MPVSKVAQRRDAKIASIVEATRTLVRTNGFSWSPCGTSPRRWGCSSRPSTPTSTEFIPFPDYDDLETRTVICSTNEVESLNARYRREVKARGHFPTELAALKCL